jgi:N-acyl-D-aspartate/D-glutamate deacylase
LAKIAGRLGGLYDTHQRDESSYSIGLMGSVDEVIRIGREANIPVHFAHIKALGVDVQGMAPAVIAAIESARASGVDVTADQYPWEASGTSLNAALLPRWAEEGGWSALVSRLNDAATLDRVRAEMRENLRRRGGAASLLMTNDHRSWTGKTLAEVAQNWKMDPIDAALRIIRGNPTEEAVASFNMRDDDITAFMQQPWVVTSSDGSDGHPRQYATFPAKYAHYVLEKKTITLDWFIRSSTGLTADMFKLDRRGYLREGYFADLVIFDPKRYRPKADYVHPRRLSEGVEALFVNGTPAILAGKLTDQRSGRPLLRTVTAAECSSPR